MIKRLSNWMIPMAVMVLSVAVATASTRGQEPPLEKITLGQVLEIVADTNPEILEAKRRYQSVLAERTIARSGYLPTVGAELAAGPEVTDGVDTNDERKSLTASTATVYARMNLFSGGKTRAIVSETDARILSAAYEVLNVTNKVFLETAEAYINVLQARAIHSLAAKNVKTQEQILSQVREKAASGFNRLSDLKNSESRLALSRSNYMSRQQSLNQAVVKLHRQLGRFVPPEAMTKPSPAFGFPDTVEAVVDVALKNHPALEVAKYNLQVRKFSVDKAKSAYWPTLDFEMKAQRRSDTGGDEGDTDYASAMLKLNYTFFDGGVRKGETLKSNQNLHGENYRGYLERRNVNETVRLAWNIFQAEKQRNLYVRDHVKLSRETLDAFKEEYHIGRRTLLDLLNMENEVNAAESTLAESAASYLIARYRIANASGLMLHEYDAGLRKEMGLKDDALVAELTYPGLAHNRDADAVEDICDQCDNSLLGRDTDPSGCGAPGGFAVGYQAPTHVAPYIIPKEGTPEALNLKIDTRKQTQSINLSSITFAHNSDVLTAESKAHLTYVADQLKSGGDFAIEVVGHTDSLGSASYNLKLSKKRAKSVRNELVALGVDAERLTFSGKGEGDPIASNTSSKGRLKNRRTEFKLTQKSFL